jgi:integrase
MAHIEKRGPSRYRARYRGADGREHSKTFQRKADAERFLVEVEAQKTKGLWTDPAAARITVREWAERWSTGRRNVRSSTQTRDEGLVRNHILPALGQIRLGSLAAVDIERFLQTVEAPGRLSPATVRKVGQVLRKMLSDAVRSGIIARSPADAVALPQESAQEMRFLTAEEVAALVQEVDPVYRPLILTACFAGLRWGELAGLRTQKVDLLRRKIHVVEQMTEVGGVLRWGPPKTDASKRSVSVPVALAQVLEEQLKRPDVYVSGLVFPSTAGTPLRRSNFRRRVWGPATLRRGLEGLRFHDLRHTAVALAIEQGAHPKTIQARMGHSSISVTLDRYGHLFPALDEQVADRLDELCARVAASSRPATAG